MNIAIIRSQIAKKKGVDINNIGVYAKKVYDPNYSEEMWNKLDSREGTEMVPGVFYPGEGNFDTKFYLLKDSEKAV